MEPNYGYKHTRGFIVFLIIILCGWVVIAHSQISNTGNLVGSTWSNGYSVPELTCWKAGDPNCSPGTPYIRPDGNINFSYSATELYQAQNLADVLPYSGVGLMVTGFQFNWRSKNGNGWDDGRLDVLQAYVQMYSKGGQWIEAQTYGLNFVHDWTSFSWSGTFSKERRGSDLGTILYGFYGKDNNYWMGPYGPEITNVNFSLRYQPDPCIVNPLHSTDCPGFLKAIASPAYQAQESSINIKPIVSTTSSAISLLLPTTTNAVVKLVTRQEQFTQETEITTTSSTMNNSSVPTTIIQAAAPITASRIRISSANSTDNVVSRDGASEQAVPIAMPQTSNIASITTASTTPFQPRLTTQTTTADNDSSAQTQISLFRTPEPVIVNQPDTQVNYGLLEPAKINTDPQPVSISTQALLVSNQPAPIVETIIVTEPIRAPTVETLVIDNQSNLIATALIDRTNPLNNALNGQQPISQITTAFTGPSVKSNTQDNDIAGGVSISQIASVPVGFDVYQNLAIREITFYQPREIYRGQRTVDNVRALRNLGQDAKHQQMIDQQYGR